MFRMETEVKIHNDNTKHLIRLLFVLVHIFDVSSVTGVNDAEILVLCVYNLTL